MTHEAKGGPLPRWLDPLAGLAVPLYARVIERRNASFDTGKRVVTIDRPVISVGNLTVGGTGKTPMVGRLVEELINAGFSPAIAMRGYKSRGGFSDEADIHRRRFPSVPVVTRANRLEGLIDLFATDEGEAVDVVVLDDGFQHRHIARQLDIVLINAAAEPGIFEDDLLPRGWLREPPASLARASAVIVTHADRVQPSTVETIRRACLQINPGLMFATARHAWLSLDVRDEDRDVERPAEFLRRKRVVAVCGIARPEVFFDSLAKAGADIAERIALGDHVPFDRPTLARIARAAERNQADAVVCTDKDWSKLRTAGRFRLPIIRPRLRIEFMTGERQLLNTLTAKAALRGNDLDPPWGKPSDEAIESEEPAHAVDEEG